MQDSGRFASRDKGNNAYPIIFSFLFLEMFEGKLIFSFIELDCIFHVYWCYYLFLIYAINFHLLQLVSILSLICLLDSLLHNRVRLILPSNYLVAFTQVRLRYVQWLHSSRSNRSAGFRYSAKA